MNKNDKIGKLIEKVAAGGQVTVDDLSALTAPRVCSAKTALEKAKRGIALKDRELKELAKNYKLSLEYANLKGEAFPECEENLLKSGDSWLVAKYFQQIAKRPNKGYEKWLVRNSQCHFILQYAQEILKARWPEGEKELLNTSVHHSLEYQRAFRIGRWKELERVLMSEDYRTKKKYFENCGVGRHPDLEEMLLKKGNGSVLYLYARYCIRGRLPAALHNKMILIGKKWSRRYLAGIANMKKTVSSYLNSIDQSEREELLAIRPETP